MDGDKTLGLDITGKIGVTIVFLGIIFAPYLHEIRYQVMGILMLLVLILSVIGVGVLFYPMLKILWHNKINQEKVKS